MKKQQHVSNHICLHFLKPKHRSVHHAVTPGPVPSCKCGVLCQKMPPQNQASPAGHAGLAIFPQTQGQKPNATRHSTIPAQLSCSSRQPNCRALNTHLHALKY